MKNVATLYPSESEKKDFMNDIWTNVEGLITVENICVNVSFFCPMNLNNMSDKMYNVDKRRNIYVVYNWRNLHIRNKIMTL